MRKNKKIIEMLKKDEEKNVCYIENIIHERCRILFLSKESVAIELSEYDIALVYCNNDDEIDNIIGTLKNYEVFFTTNKRLANEINKKYGKELRVCYQVLYSINCFEISNEIKIKRLKKTENNINFIFKNYTLNYTKDRINKLFEKRFFMGVYFKNQLAGFIGMHEERSMGFLEIIAKYRRRGLAVLLTKACANYFLSHNYTPFSHIISSNIASINLHKKINCKIQDKLVYWCI